MMEISSPASPQRGGKKRPGDPPSALLVVGLTVKLMHKTKQHKQVASRQLPFHGAALCHLGEVLRAHNHLCHASLPSWACDIDRSLGLSGCMRHGQRSRKGNQKGELEGRELSGRLRVETE